MATVDSLDIQIKASAQNASNAIDVLIGKIGSISTALKKIDTSKLSNAFKSLSDSINGNAFKGFNDFAKNVESQTKRVSKTLEQIKKQYEGLGKGFQLKGSTEYIQKQIDALTNKLENAKLAKDDFEKAGKTNLGGYETAVKNVIKYTNQIESLKNQLDFMKSAQNVGEIKFQGIEEASKKLSDFQTILNTSINDIKTLESVYGGLLNLPKGTLDNQIEALKISVEELKRSFPEATGMISAFEKELQRLQEISSGLTKERPIMIYDADSMEKAKEKIEEIRKRFEKAGSDFKFTGNFEQLNIEIEKVYSKLNELKQKEQEIISSGKIDVSGFEQLQESIARVGNKFGIMQDLRDRTDEFNQSLQRLKVPEIRETNLKKLQNSLRKTEEQTEKLKTRLANGINMGRIIPNIDDSGFRKLTEQIALSEKQAEALREKIKEVGGDTGESGSKFEKLKSALLNVSNQSVRTSSSTNILEKNIKKLSSAMSGFGASAGKAMAGMKSFARQALSAMGIYLGVYGAVRGLKKSIESSMDYIEVLNYFNAAFGQVAEKADLSAFSELGYKSADEYYNSFSERAKQLTEKMSGFTINKSGMLESGGMKSLGIDPAQLMNYQAMFGQMASSMGTTSENALKLSTVLTEIGADLASVKNMNFDKVWTDMASGLAGMSRTLDKYGANIRNVNLQQKLNELGISANISALNQNDKALLRTIILLDSTRYAWGDLATTIDQPANQLRLLKANFSNLGRAIGNIFLPIVAKVLPYINMLVQALSRLAEWLVKLLGFEGFDWGGGGGSSVPDVMGDIYDNADNASGALDKVSESAKKAKAGIRAFDELKTINMPDSGTDDGNGGDSGTGGIESGLLQGALDSILDEYQAAWDKAFSEMEDRANTFADNVAKAFKEGGLYGVGEYIGSELTKAMKSIPWDSIYEGARNFGIGLASFLNGLISPELFSALGKTIAGALNTALHFLDSFADPENGFDFANFGKSLAAGLVASLKGIDWKTALSAAKNWAVGIGTALNNFITPETFGEVGTAIGNALNVAVQFALNLGRTLDFHQFGQSIVTGINNFFKTFNFADLAETLNVWLDNLWDFIKGIIDGLEWGDIWDGVKDFFSNLELDTAVVLSIAVAPAALAGLTKLGGLFSGLVGIIGKVYDAFELLKDVFALIASPAGLVIGAIALVVAALVDLWNTSESFRNTVTASFTLVKNSLVDAFNKIKEAVAPLWDKVKELGQAFYEFYESSHLKDLVEILAKVYTVAYSIAASAVFTVIGNMISGFATMVGGVIDTLTGLLNILTGIFTLDTEKIAEGFSKILDGLREAFSGFLQQFGIDTEKIGDFFSKIDIKKITKPFADAWSNIKKIWNNAKKWFNETVITPISNVFTELKTNVHNSFTNAWNLAKGVWEKVSGWFTTNILTPVTTTFSNIKKNIHNAFTNAWNLARNVWSKVSGWFNDNIKMPITNTFNTVKNNVHNAFSNAWSLTRGVWNKVSGWFTDHIKTPVTNTFNSLRDGIKNAFTNAYNGIKNTFSSIGDFFKGIANNIISPIGDAVNGIINGINWVLDKLKVPKSDWLKEWPVPQFAKGANGLTQDTIGIVNDQKGNTYKELIVPPHGKPFIPEGRNVMLPMEKGTKIMPAKQTKEFMQKMNGMPHFAGGIGDFFSGAWAKITEFTGNIWDYISNPGKILQIAIDKFTDFSGMLEPVLSIAKGAASTLLGGATDFIKKIFDEQLTVNYNPSAGVEQWRGLATKALQITNQFTASNLNALLNQMQHESSGNPRAINLWDANAKKGTPSKGLMQVIDPTFRTYALSPHNKDIYDPLSNMIASIRYTLSRYGSLYAGWTARGYKGYAGGIGKIDFADLIPQYRVGGFPEDGLFYANHNELVGQFSNGQTAVANNEQITQGIAEAIYPAVYNAVSAAMRNNDGNGNVTFQVEGDPNGIFKVVQKEWKNEARRLQKNPVPIYVD